MFQYAILQRKEDHSQLHDVDIDAIHSTTGICSRQDDLSTSLMNNTLLKQGIFAIHFGHQNHQTTVHTVSGIFPPTVVIHLCRGLGCVAALKTDTPLGNVEKEDGIFKSGEW